MSISGKKIRIKDVAGLAGVSPGTVDRVIHNRGQVTEENRLKIMKIIEELDYKPNLIARSLANKKSYLFVSLCPEFHSDNDYWKAPDAGIDKAAREINNYNITVKKFYFDQFSVSSFTNQLAYIQSINPDGVLLSPVFRKETMNLVNELDKRQVPYVFIDSNIDGLNNLSYLGQNSFQSGYLAARLMNFSVPEKSSILILRTGGSEISNQSIHRKNGINNFFNTYGNHKIIHLDVDPEKKDSTKGIEEQFGIEKFKGVIIINSKAFDVADFFERLNIEGVNLIGYDLLPANIEYLKKGVISFLIAQRPEYQGYKGILSLFDHIVLKTKIEKYNYLPIDILTSENIDYYINYI